MTLPSSIRAGQRSKQRTIVSEKISYKNSQDMTIVACVDRPMGESRTGPYVVVVPGYAETKKDQISLAYYLVANGFRVVRYDHTCHLGESDGDILDTDPSRMFDDLSATLDYVERRYGQTNVGVIASSVSARVALRVASVDRRVGFIVSLVGVVDVQRTLRTIYREDLVKKYLEGERWGSLDILGHEVREAFLESLVRGKFHDLSTTLKDARLITAPILFIAAERDVWVRVEDIRKLVRCLGPRRGKLQVIPTALHQLQENPRLAKLIIDLVVRSCLKNCRRLKSDERYIKRPAIHDITDQNKTEREWFRGRQEISKGEERQFWSQYLSKYAVIIRSPDYKNFLACTGRVLGHIGRGENLLDAGCGSGHFGAWLLKPLFEELKLKNRGDRKVAREWNYVGLDFSDKALMQSVHRHGELLSKCQGDSPKKNCIAYRYVLADLEARLPFRDAYFDKIVCNLVLSYVSDPLVALKELVRVLKPGKPIIVSSLKPYCDLSLIYSHFVERANSAEELQEAKELLSNAGKIRQKESEGHYRFFSESELQQIMRKAGLGDVQLFRTLGNQANLAIGKKLTPFQR